MERRLEEEEVLLQDPSKPSEPPAAPGTSAGLPLQAWTVLLLRLEEEVPLLAPP